jgi:phospholipase/carboxylesterase
MKKIDQMDVAKMVIPKLTSDLALRYLEFSSLPVSVRQGPLILFLHGRGANEMDLFELAPQLELQCIVLSVRAPIDMGPESYGWFHTAYPPGGKPVYDLTEVHRSRDILVRFIQQVQAKYKTPPEETYLMGFSQGSIMSFGLALNFPELIAGVCAMSGRILPEDLLPNPKLSSQKNFPILLSHGTQDEVLSVEYARDAKATLEKLPIKLSYYEHPMGHNVTDMNFRPVKEWFQQTVFRK